MFFSQSQVTRGLFLFGREMGRSAESMGRSDGAHEELWGEEEELKVFFPQLLSTTTNNNNKNNKKTLFIP